MGPTQGYACNNSAVICIPIMYLVEWERKGWLQAGFLNALTWAPSAGDLCDGEHVSGAPGGGLRVVDPAPKLTPRCAVCS